MDVKLRNNKTDKVDQYVLFSEGEYLRDKGVHSAKHIQAYLAWVFTPVNRLVCFEIPTKTTQRL